MFYVRKNEFPELNTITWSNTIYPVDQQRKDAQQLLEIIAKEYVVDWALMKPDDIVDVIFNDPATIIKWKDGTKTIVKCQPGDKYDKEAGLALAICKKVFGNKGNYNEVFKKWVD